MESSGIDGEPAQPRQERGPQISLTEVGNEPRKYMSKSRRACDFCRARKSACQSTEKGLSCRLCSSHRRPCTFISGSLRAANRKPKRFGTQQQVPNENMGSTRAEIDISDTSSRSFEVERRLDEESPAIQESYGSRLSTGSIEGWNGPIDQLRAEIGLFSQDILPSTEFETVLTALPGSIENTVSGEYPQFDSQHLLDPEFFDLQTVYPEDCQIENTSGDVITQVMGPTGDQNPHMIKYHRYNAQNLFTYNRISYRSVADLESSVQFEYIRVEPSSVKAKQLPNHETLLSEKIKLDDMVPPEAGLRFIQLYYKFVNPQFPILSMTEIPSPSDSPSHLLAAIYLVAEQFSPFDDYLCLHVVYKPTPLKELLDMVWKLISSSMHRPTISIIQAGLILLLKPALDGFGLDRPFKWSLMGFIINTAQTLGLHLSPESWRIPYHEIQLRKRISWMTFVMNKWFALSFGSPSNLTEDNWSISQFPTSAVVPPGSETRENLLSIQLSKLTVILSTALQKLFSVASLQRLRGDYHETLRIGRCLLSELSTWHAALPEFIPSISHTGIHQDSITDNSASLELGYHTVQLVIYRELLRAFGSTLTTIQERETNQWKEANEQCRTDAKAAVISFLQFTSSLGPSHFQSFWAPWTSTGFTMMGSVCIALIVTSRSHDEAEEYRLTLDKVRGTLRTQSRSFEMMRFALLKLDAIFFVDFDRVFRSDLEGSSAR